MVNRPGQLVIIMLAVLLLALPMLAACNGGDDDKEPTAPSVTPTSQTTGPAEDVVITIGNITDATGTGANAMAVIDMALEDLVRYFNEENLIPGVELKVIMYDEQSDPSRDIPGYEWLKMKGADLMFTPLGWVSESLQVRLEKDEIVLFTVDASPEDLYPPGHIFLLTTLASEMAEPLMRWIAENDWDYKVRGPAKVGGAGWFIPYQQMLLDSMEEYCSAHPDQFEWKGGYLNDFSFSWDAEVEALKDCDYVVPPIVMATFVKAYRQAGHTAKFLGSDSQAAFLGLIGDARLWEEIDGMLFLRIPRWWNEEDEIVNLAKKLLYDYHPGSAENTIRSGSSYLAVSQLNLMLQIIADAVEAKGPQGFSSQALYDAAKSFSLTIDDITFSFNDTKRTCINYYGMYEASAAEEDLFRADPEWLAITRAP
ncbi:MAG: ABC transporter substrate-binding protein [Chloroflexi bacterium]|nr:ABC transporter substrate-binding protein [Chloroflexota bacterium]